MANDPQGQIRRSQVITTWGPGALIDLPRHSAIIGGLEHWPKLTELDEIREPRLARKLQVMTGVVGPQLFSPPTERGGFARPPGINVFRFPSWFVVQGDAVERAPGVRSRRLVHRKHLGRGLKFEKNDVVPTRFVCGCPRGHVDDVDWTRFVHGPDLVCAQPLWLDEHGVTGDLGELAIRCECGKSRGLAEALDFSGFPLGYCSGKRPWLGKRADEPCSLPNRLLIRTGANAYFAQQVSVLSLPDPGGLLQKAVRSIWEDLQFVTEAADIRAYRKKPRNQQALEGFSDEEVLAAIQGEREGTGEDRPVKLVEIEAILGAPEGFGDDVPIDPDFHARSLPDPVWRRRPSSAGIERVIQLHRLREVLALCGFTRFEAEMPDIHGEYETDVERAPLAIDPKWFPAVENRGEGIFLQLRAAAVEQWLARTEVQQRLGQLEAGHLRWIKDRKIKRVFPGGPYILLHTLSHLLIQSLAMSCGYPASSIRERIYSEPTIGGYGLLLYTGSSDAEGTLGGLVQEARHIEAHLAYALRLAALCSNDPICAQHVPESEMEGRFLHGAACHGCALVAETSCEMRNDYLDRALVVPVIGLAGAAFFGAV